VARRRKPGADFPTRPIGLRSAAHEDLFHRILLMPWWRFYLLVVLGFFLANSAFAVLYLLQPGSLIGAREGSFFDAFFFSVQTMGTIGYGVLSPATPYAHVLTAFETLTGLLGFAIVTGLTFSKFARPTARVLFSEKVVVTKRDGKAVLLLRVANERLNNIVEAQARLIALVDRRTAEGEFRRILVPLKLERDTNPFFRLTWTICHVIDEESPFFGPDAQASLREQNTLLLVTVTGLDETIVQPVHARYNYQLEDIHYNHRFRDVVTVEPDGTRVVNYRYFHDVEADGLTRAGQSASTRL
jgi:inward rectifier potassium channel